MIGTLIANRYLIVAAVGGGGMADVYRAEDRRLGRPVAVKMLRREFLKDREFVRRFENEARAAASLSHPNVVRVYDVGETDDGNRYIVMEFVEGETLKDLLRAVGPLSVRQALTVGLAVAQALAAAHRKGIVHRDIKPENILVTREGDVKVTDFGIARAASGRTIVHTGTIVGSAHYFSPEQARGGFVDEKSDLYSLGAVLFELLVGRPPFEADSPIALALRHVQDPVPSLRKLRPVIPRRVEQLVQKLLAKDPQDRFRTAEAACRQIEAVLLELGGPEPLGRAQRAPALDPGSRRRGGRRARSMGLSIALAAVVVLAAVTLLVYRAAVLWLDTPTIHVPNVVGSPLPEARRRLLASHLVVAVVASRPARSKKGTVVAQEPAAGTPVKEGRQIDVVLSSGPPRVDVPSLRGEPLGAARATLAALGLRARLVWRSAGEPTGTVLAQSPPPGKVTQGSFVTLVVARQASVFLNMPNLVGLTLQAAAQDLENLGLAVASTDYAPSSAPYGTVLSQSIAPGTKVRSGEGVALTLSQGPPAGGTGGPPQSEPVTLTYQGSQPAEVRVVVVDDSGVSQVLDETENPGQSVSLSLTWQGSGRLEVYVGAELVFSQALPLTSGNVTVGGGA